MSSKGNSTERQVGVQTDYNTAGRDDEHLVKTRRSFLDIPGKINLIKHKIELTENNPVRYRPHSLPYAMREKLKKEIDGMLSLGIVRESSSPFESPIVIVKKKDGSDRICVDYRKLNKFTVADPEPMTTAGDLF